MYKRQRYWRVGGGRLFTLYVMGYTFGRFFIENMRTDAATTVFGDVRINVVVSAVVFLAATALFVWWTVQQRKAEGVTNQETK